MADRTIIASRDGVAQVLADLVWSPDGASLAFTNGPTLEVWDAALAVNRRTEELGTPVVSLAWNPAGTHLAGVSQEPGGRLRIWDLRSPGKPLDLPARLPRVWSVRWREPGDRIILAGAGLLRVFDPGTQRVMHAFEADGLITDLDMPGDGTAVYAVVKPKLGNPVVRRWQAAPVTP
jgi:WD40 repeat protein